MQELTKVWLLDLDEINDNLLIWALKLRFKIFDSNCRTEQNEFLNRKGSKRGSSNLCSITVIQASMDIAWQSLLFTHRIEVIYRNYFQLLSNRMDWSLYPTKSNYWVIGATLIHPLPRLRTQRLELFIFPGFIPSIKW